MIKNDKKNILIIENNEKDLKQISLLLSTEYNVLEAKSGKEGVTFFFDHHMSINLMIISDELNDFSVKEIHQKCEAICFTDIPNIIILSNKNKPVDLICAMLRNQIFESLEKPIDNVKFKSTVKEAIHQSFSRKEYELSQDIAIDKILSDRNSIIIDHLRKFRESQGEVLSEEDLHNYCLLNTKQAKKNMPLSQILNLIKEDTGENPAKAWKPKLLIIEDEQDFRETLEEFFIDKKYNVLLAEDGPEGLKKIKEHSDIDIILLDLGLPGISGKSLIDAVQQTIGLQKAWLIEPNEKPDIIVITSYHDKNTITSTIKSGAHNYLIKPISLNDILAEVKRTFYRRYCLKELPRLINILEQQKAPFRFRFEALNMELKKESALTITYSKIYALFPEYRSKQYHDNHEINKPIDENLKKVLMKLKNASEFTKVI